VPYFNTQSAVGIDSCVTPEAAAAAAADAAGMEAEMPDEMGEVS